MPTGVVLAFLVAVVATLGALAWGLRLLVVRLGTLGEDLRRLEADVSPALEDLRRDAAVTTVELEALGDRLDDWRETRATRPRRRWRPPRP